MYRDKAISITHIDLPQWSRVLHPKQMIHALVERQETQVYREVHPEEKTSLRRKDVNCLVRRIGQRKKPETITSNRTPDLHVKRFVPETQFGLHTFYILKMYFR